MVLDHCASCPLLVGDLAVVSAPSLAVTDTRSERRMSPVHVGLLASDGGVRLELSVAVPTAPYTVLALGPDVLFLLLET